MPWDRRAISATRCDIIEYPDWGKVRAAGIQNADLKADVPRMGRAGASLDYSGDELWLGAW